MRTITLKTAKTIAADWLGGQWSALYAFASGGQLPPAKEPLCLAEIEGNLNAIRIGRQAKRLQQLKSYFENSKRPNTVSGKFGLGNGNKSRFSPLMIRKSIIVRASEVPPSEL